MASQFEVLFIDYVKLGGNLLKVGDALGVHTLDDVVDMVGNFSLYLVDDIVVVDVDDGGVRSNQSNLVGIFFGEVFVFDLDDAFAAEFLAVEVVANQYFVGVLFQT